MHTRFPALNKEYEVSMSKSEDETPPVEKIMIDGYQVIFDKKIKLTPVDVVALVQPTIIPSPR